MRVCVCQREYADPRANDYPLWGNIQATQREREHVREGGERGGKGCPRVNIKLNQKHVEDCVCVCLCVSLREFPECNEVEVEEADALAHLNLTLRQRKQTVYLHHNYFYFK